MFNNRTYFEDLGELYYFEEGIKRLEKSDKNFLINNDILFVFVSFKITRDLLLPLLSILIFNLFLTFVYIF